MTELNLDNMPAFDGYLPWVRQDIFKEFPELKYLGEISERIYGCSHFLTVKSDLLYPYLRYAAHLRAAITELVSISEFCKKEYGKESPLFIDNSSLPLLHFFKLLRVVNYHLSSFKSSTVAGLFQLQDTESGDATSSPFTVEFFIISNCSPELFFNCDNMQHYHASQFNDLLKLVDETQNQYGIFHVLECGLKQYCALIRDHMAV